MSYQLVGNYADTPIEGVESLALPRPALNFAEDFRVQSDEKGETILTNVTSPLDRPETIRFGYTEVSNVYANTSIDPSVYAPSKRGISVLAQLSDVLSYQDPEDASKARIDLPISAHIVVKVPASEQLNAEEVEKTVSRLVSTLYETGDSGTTRLAALLRGSLKPSDI